MAWGHFAKVQPTKWNQHEFVTFTQSTTTWICLHRIIIIDHEDWDNTQCLDKYVSYKNAVAENILTPTHCIKLAWSLIVYQLDIDTTLSTSRWVDMTHMTRTVLVKFSISSRDYFCRVTKSTVPSTILISLDWVLKTSPRWTVLFDSC